MEKLPKGEKSKWFSVLGTEVDCVAEMGYRGREEDGSKVASGCTYDRVLQLAAVFFSWDLV